MTSRWEPWTLWTTKVVLFYKFWKLANQQQSQPFACSCLLASVWRRYLWMVDFWSCLQHFFSVFTQIFCQRSQYESYMKYCLCVSIFYISKWVSGETFETQLICSSRELYKSILWAITFGSCYCWMTHSCLLKSIMM